MKFLSILLGTLFILTGVYFNTSKSSSNIANADVSEYESDIGINNVTRFPYEDSVVIDDEADVFAAVENYFADNGTSVINELEAQKESYNQMLSLTENIEDKEKLQALIDTTDSLINQYCNYSISAFSESSSRRMKVVTGLL